MTDADTKALAIYELMLSTCADRPSSANSIEDLHRRTRAWQDGNPALIILRESEPAVLLAFLKRSFEWLRANREIKIQNLQICHTLSDAIAFILRSYPHRTPPEVILQIIAAYRQDYSIARSYFPFDLLLVRLSKDQITDEIRGELRKIHLQLAPSPTGKIDERAKATRDRIAELIHVEGEQQLDAGRGPWSQIVFDEIKSKEPIARAGWEALLEHCKSLQQTTPSAKWKKRAEELVTALGEGEVASCLLRWLALGPAPGQPSEARSPIEDSPYQKGVVWCLASVHAAGVPAAIADFGLACLRKIPMVGAVSQKVGLACVQALGAMGSREAISQLTRMRAKIKYSVARSLIHKALLSAASSLGVSVHELEDYAVERYGLDERGCIRFDIGDVHASVQLHADGRVAIVWRSAAGKIVRAAPSAAKKAFPKEVRAVASRAKDLEQAYSAQKARLEESLLTTREMPLNHWRQYFLEHPLLGILGRSLIWVFRSADGSELSAMCNDGQLRDSSGNIVDVSGVAQVRLWHPLSTETSEVQRWRDFVFQRGVRQPFRQAFRESYQVTDADRETRLYSNRFAGILMRQHQFSTLCRARGWDYRLMGAGFDGANVPMKKLDSWNIHAEFYVDLPSDRNPALRDSGLGEQSDSGINVFVGSDQVRFYRDRKEIAVDEVPALVYSEIMRDVDLFTSVCAVGGDETWSDQGDRGLGVIPAKFDADQLSAIITLRADLLSRILPHTPIAGRCKILKYGLEVRGQLGTYRIDFAWGGAALVTEKFPRWLAIPQKILSQVELNLDALPIDLDYRTELVLRKAYLLASDSSITDPDLIRQLMPE